MISFLQNGNITQMVSCNQLMFSLAITIVLLCFIAAGLLLTFSVSWERPDLAVIGIIPLVIGGLLASYVGMRMVFQKPQLETYEYFIIVFNENYKTISSISLTD